MMNKNEIVNLFKSFNDQKVLIIGDVMLDAYYFGKVDRISPEAPVPIVTVKNREVRLGGAANVALNIKALGATPVMCAVIGKDRDGDKLRELVKAENMSDAGIIDSAERMTTSKTRVIGNKHQVIRVDAEDDHALSTNEEQALLAKINELVAVGDIDVVIFQDYDKGVITENLIAEVIKTCTEKGIPTAVDPKKRNFMHFKGATLFKPNLKELNEGLNIAVTPSNTSEVEQGIDQLNESLGNKINFVTLSEYGVFIKDGASKAHIPAHLRSISDVSGAGDTVISVAALCLALNQPIAMIGEIANLAGGLVCESVGVVSVDKDQLLSEAITHLI